MNTRNYNRNRDYNRYRGRVRDDYGYIHKQPALAKNVQKCVRVLVLFGILCLIVYFAVSSVVDLPPRTTFTSAEIEAFAEYARLQAQAAALADLSLVHSVAEQRTAAYNFNMNIPFVAQLVELIPYYPAAAVIAEYIWRIPLRLVELALHNNETIDFVAAFPVYGRRVNIDHEDIDVSGEIVPGRLPHFLQWDTRWGFTYYGTEVMAVTGCGPTSLSMVAVGLTGNPAFNPRQVADFAMERGFITADNSSTWTLMSVGALDYGLNVREVIADAAAITNALNRGEPIIASMRPGDFTTGGHFIVLTCVNLDGTVNILDSNSYLLTEVPWELSRIIPQMRNIWAFSLAE